MIEEKDWYLPWEVVPTVYQLENFVLPYLDDLRLGSWPPDCRTTGYTNDGMSIPTNNKAHFVDAIDLAAEIDERMNMMVNSEALILYYTDPRGVGHNPDLKYRDYDDDKHPVYNYRRIAWMLHFLDEHDLEIEMHYMLKYVAGSKRKTQTYPRWKEVARRQQKKRIQYVIIP